MVVFAERSPTWPRCSSCNSNPSDPAYVAGTLNPVCDVHPEGTKLCQNRSSVPIVESPPTVRRGRDSHGDSQTDAPSATSAVPPRRNASAMKSSVSRDVQPERNRHAVPNSRNSIPLQASRYRPPRRDRSRRTTPRPVAGYPAMPEVRSQRLARPLVRQDCTGRGTGSSSGATPRLGRVAGYNPAYVAGNGLPAFIRARDGPLLIRYPISVV
jgi:hypothetical protein